MDKPLVEHKEVDIPNDCFVNALSFANTAKEQLVGSKPRLMQLSVTRVEDHAVCVFCIDDEWFVYDDNAGTYTIGKFKRPPTAKEVMKHMPDDVYAGMSSPKWVHKGL